jgi:hypothetical protein
VTAEKRLDELVEKSNPIPREGLPPPEYAWIQQQKEALEQCELARDREVTELTRLRLPSWEPAPRDERLRPYLNLAEQLQQVQRLDSSYGASYSQSPSNMGDPKTLPLDSHMEKGVLPGLNDVNVLPTLEQAELLDKQLRSALQEEGSPKVKLTVWTPSPEKENVGLLNQHQSWTDRLTISLDNGPPQVITKWITTMEELGKRGGARQDTVTPINMLRPINSAPSEYIEQRPDRTEGSIGQANQNADANAVLDLAFIPTWDK